MKICQHQWRFASKEPHGEDRVIHTWKCSLCHKTRTRNLKKPRFMPYAELLERKSKKPRKKAKTSQKPPECKRKAIRKVSDKRKAENKAYLKIRARFLETHPYCMVCFNSLSTQVHHQRGKEGPWLTDVSEFLSVCFACHERIETNREWATKQGYLKLRLTTDQLKDHVQEHLPEELA